MAAEHFNSAFAEIHLHCLQDALLLLVSDYLAKRLVSHGMTVVLWLNEALLSLIES